jgi:hypothetical protein
VENNMGKSGVIYIMTTSVKGLIKIGKTDDFKKRMFNLEQNGYWNVSGLHPFYAVRVKDYDAKEKLIHTIFSKSQVANSELFALDKDIAKQMLESFDGEQIYPEVKHPQTVVSKPNLEKKCRLTFEMLGIPVGSELIYIKDSNIKVRTVDLGSTVEYQGHNYKMSALIKHLIGHGSWQGSTFFTYQGEKLTDMRDRLGL